MGAESGTSIDERLFALLACPWCLGALERPEGALRCRRCGAVYRVEDGIANLLIADALLSCPFCARPLARTSEASAECPGCGRRFDTTRRLGPGDLPQTVPAGGADASKD